MIDYLKKNHLSLLIIVFLVGTMIVNGGGGGAVGAPRALTTFTNPITFNQEIVVNESGVDVDSRFEGDTNANLLVVDAGLDSVFADLLTTGGATSTSSTTPASMTLSTADVCDNKVLSITPTVGNVTLTFPTATLLAADCIPNAGDDREFWLQNASTTGTAAITIADGTGGVHLEAEGATTIVDINEWALIRMVNIYGGTGYILDVEVHQDAD